MEIFGRILKKTLSIIMYNKCTKQFRISYHKALGSGTCAVMQNQQVIFAHIELLFI